jgi:hypothetical protein
MRPPTSAHMLPVFAHRLSLASLDIDCEEHRMRTSVCIVLSLVTWNAAAHGSDSLVSRGSIVYEPVEIVSHAGEMIGGVAQAINDAGEIVGTAALTDRRVNRPFLWQCSTGMIPLDAIRDSDISSEAEDINRWGTIVGRSYDYPLTVPEAFVWNERDGLVPVPSTNFVYAGVSINDRGTIIAADYDGWFIRRARHDRENLDELIGSPELTSDLFLDDWDRVYSSRKVAGSVHFFMWSRRGGTRDLGAVPAGFRGVNVRAVNNRGDIVGALLVEPGGGVSFIRRANGEIQLMTEAVPFDVNSAEAINDRRQVVGYLTNSLFLWDPERGMRDLESLIRKPDPEVAWNMTGYLGGINLHGWIVVHARPNFQHKIVLLVPVPARDPYFRNLQSLSPPALCHRLNLLRLMSLLGLYR